MKRVDVTVEVAPGWQEMEATVYEQVSLDALGKVNAMMFWVFDGFELAMKDELRHRCRRGRA